MLNNETRLSQSKYIQAVEDKEKIAIWHSLFGKPKVVSKEMLEFLKLFDYPRSLRSLLDEYELTESDELCLNEMIKDYYIIPGNFDERQFLTEKMKSREQQIISGAFIDNLELIMSEACNFRCTYCIHFNNLETVNHMRNPEKFMRFEIAKEAVDGFLKILRQHRKKIAEVNFGGGEPLLNWQVIERTLDYCKTAYGKEFDFNFSINTNASFINGEIAKKLKECRVSIAASLDGLKESNDRVRLTKSGKGTFDLIMKGFKNLAVQNYPLDGIAVTIDEHNFDYIDERIIDWAVEQHMHEVRIDIDVVKTVELSIKDAVKKLIRLRQYAKKYGIEVFGFWSRPAENLNNSVLEEPISFCGAIRGNSICVNPTGQIYSCGYSTTQLGTIAGIDSFYKYGGQYHDFVRSHLIGMIEMCKGCTIEGQCNGGCNITQEFVCITKTEKLARMCDFYRQMTRELIFEQLCDSIV